jgi:hypothetical protein
MTSLSTRLTVALSLAAGAFLYASDRDKRHWRVALTLGTGAVVLAASPFWQLRSGRGVLVALTAVAAGG